MNSSTENTIIDDSLPSWGILFWPRVNRKICVTRMQQRLLLSAVDVGESIEQCSERLANTGQSFLDRQQRERPPVSSPLKSSSLAVKAARDSFAVIVLCICIYGATMLREPFILVFLVWLIVSYGSFMISPSENEYPFVGDFAVLDRERGVLCALLNKEETRLCTLELVRSFRVATSHQFHDWSIGVRGMQLMIWRSTMTHYYIETLVGGEPLVLAYTNTLTCAVEICGVLNAHLTESRVDGAERPQDPFFLDRDPLIACDVFLTDDFPLIADPPIGCEMELQNVSPGAVCCKTRGMSPNYALLFYLIPLFILVFIVTVDGLTVYSGSQYSDYDIPFDPTWNLGEGTTRSRLVNLLTARMLSIALSVIFVLVLMKVLYGSEPEVIVFRRDDRISNNIFSVLNSFIYKESVADLRRAEACRVIRKEVISSERRLSQRLAGTDFVTGRRYSLTLVNTQNKPIANVDNLREDECLYLAHTLKLLRPSLFSASNRRGRNIRS